MDHTKLNLGQHGWSASCRPTGGTAYHKSYKTFSVSFYRMVPKARGKKLKREPVKQVRLTGPCDKEEEVIQRAYQIVALLDQGRLPDKKREVIK